MENFSELKITWIRNPVFDLFWILSGIPFGAALTCLSVRLPMSAIILWTILLTQTGHLLSPMVLAWSHEDFRAIMLRRRIKFVVVPVGILLGSALTGFFSGRKLPLRFDAVNFTVAAGPATLAELKNPFMAMVALYAAWNAYHFGKQAFGVMSIYRHKQGSYGTGQRRIDLVYCCTVVWAAMAMPFIPKIAEGIHNLTGWPAHPHPFLDYVKPVYFGAALILISAMLAREWWSLPRRRPGGRSLPRAIFILTYGLGLILIFHFGLWGFAIIALNHWLVAIGIASHIHARSQGPGVRGQGRSWLFALAVMGVGFALFCALFVDFTKVPTHGLSTAALSFTVTAVSIRLGLGFVHFLYDRWLYKLSDPQVRATIGKDVFCPAPISCAPHLEAARTRKTR
jgi:hypothetical protein